MLIFLSRSKILGAINTGGILADDSKVSIMKDYPTPKSGNEANVLLHFVIIMKDLLPI